MTKRRIEGAIEGVTDDVLRELGPMKRLQSLLEAHARDKERGVEQLHETCPPEQAALFGIQKKLALLLALTAVYTLHTTALHLELLKTEQAAVNSVDFLRDEPPSTERLEEAANRANDIHALFGYLYVTYHSYRRFAEDVLGVDLETWLALHEDGPLVIDLVEVRLKTSTWSSLKAEWPVDDIEVSIDIPDEETLDARVEKCYTDLVALWSDQLTSPVPGRRR